jgi:hypothetical protein
MNTLYSLPLHGLGCKPYCNSENVKYSLLLNTEKIVLENKQCIWQLEDKGERYTTNVELYIEQSVMGGSDKTQNSDANKYTRKANGKNLLAWPHNELYLKVDCEGKGIFKVSPQQIQVDWLGGTDFTHYFQTLVAALWLELSNVACIHANALAYNNKAIALVAPSRMGKSTLTLSLIEQGFKLMTDDMLALHQNEENQNITVFPSWPVTRMWPDSLKTLVNEPLENTPKVHEKFSKRIVNFDAENNHEFCNQTKTLHTVYFLNRVDSTNNNSIQKVHSIEKNNAFNKTDTNTVCNIESIKASDAIMLLIQNSILGSAYQALGLEKQRVMFFASLFKNINFKQINYLSGFEHLPQVQAAIKQDIIN